MVPYTRLVDNKEHKGLSFDSKLANEWKRVWGPAGKLVFVNLNRHGSASTCTQEAKEITQIRPICWLACVQGLPFFRQCRLRKPILSGFNVS